MQHNLNMLVLASASPRRRELLAQAGFSFEVHPAHIPEEPYPNEDPAAYVTRLAREKAQAVFNEIMGAPGPASGTWETTISKSEDGQLGAPSFSRSLRKGWETTNPHGPSVSNLAVLGADTTVALDDHILGKPESPADAARMLRLLSGRTHRVLTGVALVTATSTQVAAESTAVQFLTLSDEEIDAYIATGEPMDKAGAYAIQGRAARWIPRIEGCYFNVVGLPIALVSSLLKARPAR
jgi:septum formation protein